MSNAPSDQSIPGQNAYDESADTPAADAVRVVVPPEPPTFTPAAARAILRLLLAVGDPIPFAFYGRVSTEDNQDPESSRQWQISLATSLITPRGGQIVESFFDIGQTRALPWARRPEASRLLALLANPRRGFAAVVIGEPHRAFYGNQFGLTLPLFAHYGVSLWVPDVGGPIDPDNEAHDLVMSVFGGMSKGERSRIKVRVRRIRRHVEGHSPAGQGDGTQFAPYGLAVKDQTSAGPVSIAPTSSTRGCN
jgi:hypothetical protein